ncbi:zinc finger protein 570 [Aedes albopictus]|uniref:C2h2-type zn-finger protein n=1 Tax=Aedes albopictus TaxID=7160 RepID=A0ABM1ZTM2_AEDAL|nr:zinc finger protein 570-like [Aedes albopictus]
MKTESEPQQDTAELCRTCMQHKFPASMLPIGTDLEEGAPIAGVIGELTAVQVQERDGLPEKVCVDCVEEMRNFVGFIRKVRTSDRKLRRMCKGESAAPEVVAVKVESEPWNCKEEMVVHEDLAEEVLEEVVVEEEYLEDDVDWKLGEEPTNQSNTTAGNSSEIEFVGFDDAEANPPVAVSDLTTRKQKRKRLYHRYNKNPTDYTVLDEVEQQIFITIERGPNDLLCCACYKIFEDDEEFKDHCEEHRKKARLNVLRPNVCEICSKRYTTAQGLTLHMIQSQQANNVYECIRCKSRFLNSKTRRHHAHNHPQKEVIQSAVIAPIRIQPNHRKGRICCAQGCAESFATDEELIEHAHEAHRLNKMASTLPEYQNRPFECPVCYKRFFDQAGLISHQKRKYKNPIRQCSICGAKVPGAAALAAHERMHTGIRPFPCGSCHKSFASPALLRAHSLVHQKEKSFMCSTCGKGFNRKATLQKHELIHANLSVFDCDVCGKPFRTKSRLDLHTRTHSGFKPYPCRYCDKAFADHSNRHRHEMSHTGIKPYKCTQCDKTFITKRLQAEHERSNHAIATVYTCSICMESYTNRASLTKHMALHDDEDASAVTQLVG